MSENQTLKEQASIKEAVDEFLSKNQNKFEVLKTFEEQLTNLTKESFQESILLIKNHLDIFFKDHASVISFMQIIERALVFHFKTVELILDIVIYFSTEIRQSQITDYEILSILLCYPVSINYLFYKNFFPIESIIKQSYSNDYIFVNFLPEIEQYDKEYAELRDSNFQLRYKRDFFVKFYNDVKNDPKQHQRNRGQLYHPSALHKAIRDDDIDTFQSLLSKNNYNVNHKIPFSYYERAQTIDLNLSLIQIAATYGSINIFKFLWMQNGICPPSNLLQYAFFGCNNDIIHLCENKMSHEKAILQTIFMCRFDLLDYYLENFGEKIVEKDEVTKYELKKFQTADEENDLYDYLSTEELKAALNYYSIPILETQLQRIIFIIQNVDLKRESHDNDYLLSSSIIYYDLFAFLFSQIDSEVNSESLLLKYCLRESIVKVNIDTFKFLCTKLKDNNIDSFSAMLGYSLRYNLVVVNYILDLYINETIQLFNSGNINVNINSFCCYDEDAFAKLIKLESMLSDDQKVLCVKYFSIELIKSKLEKFASKKMIHSLFVKLSGLLSDDELMKYAAALLSSEDKQFVCDLIMKKNGK